VGSGRCTCNTDPVCASIGDTCASASSKVTCMQDAQACLYQAAVSPCANGACTGTAGAASCCTNACTAGTTCASSTSYQSCAIGSNGCTALGATTTCSNGACTGSAGSASCCTHACAVGAPTCATSNSLQTCAVGSDSCRALTATNCATGMVCERYGTPDCLDPNWAEWPMPNSQSDVAAGAGHLAGFTDNGDGTITDNNTKLTWQKTVTTDKYTWALADGHCKSLPLGGYSDWRLPTVIELTSIVDYGQGNPSINGIYFPNTPWDDFFWTSTKWADSSASAWYIYFNYGYTNYLDGTYEIYVRCVR